MAKALFGYIDDGPDARVLSDIRRLRRRLHELEDALAKMDHKDRESAADARGDSSAGRGSGGAATDRTPEPQPG